MSDITGGICLKLPHFTVDNIEFTEYLCKRVMVALSGRADPRTRLRDQKPDFDQGLISRDNQFSNRRLPRGQHGFSGE